MIYETNSPTAIELYQGDTLDVKFTIEDEDDSPVDLTGWSVRFRVFGTDILKSSAVAGEITITSVAGGIATVHLIPADTTGLTQGYKYVYDGEIYNDEIVYTFAQGTFKIT